MKENYLGTPVDPALWQTYHDLAIKKGQTLEDLVTAALYDYLEWKPPIEAEGSLLKELEDLKEKVKELEGLQGQFNRLNLTVQVLENKLEYLLTNQKKTNKKEEMTASTMNHPPEPSDSNEDDYDEPDEVLWDFVEN